jgi:type IV pilus assembly protein PilM
MFLKKPQIGVGLDIGSSLIKVVEISGSGKTVTLTNYGIATLLPEAIVEGEIMDRDVVIDTIRTLFDTKNIKKREVASAVSGRGVIVKKILMERMKESEARERIQWEAEQHIPFDINDVTLDFKILNPEANAEQMEVLLVAVKNETVNSYLGLITSAGLSPSLIDIGFFALQNAFEWNYTSPPGEVVALINIGADVTSINVVKDHSPFFTRDLPTAGNQCLQLMQKNLGLSSEQAGALLKGETLEGLSLEASRPVFESFATEFASGLERTFSFLSAAGEAIKVGQLYLAGGNANIPGLVEFLQQRFTIPTSILNPLQRVTYDPRLFSGTSTARVAPILSAAVGLALREVI